MLLTAEEFAAGAQQLAAAWQAHLPGDAAWQWVPCRAPFAAGKGGGYLARQHGLAAPLHQQQQVLAAGASGAQQPAGVRLASSSSDVESIPDADDEEEDAANARLAASADGGSRLVQAPSSARPADTAAATAAAPPGLSLACHIAYHPSYQVPVLYLEAAGRDGSPLVLPALLDSLPCLREAVEGGQPYTVLTQEEHPFLHRPWFMLHPCQTAAIMQLLSGAQQEDAAAALRPAAAAAAESVAQPATRQAGSAVQQQAAAARGGQAGRPCPLRYLLAWLSVVGQPLGIPVPPDLWQRCL